MSRRVEAFYEIKVPGLRLDVRLVSLCGMDVFLPLYETGLG
jgi:hypothetical protein